MTEQDKQHSSFNNVMKVMPVHTLGDFDHSFPHQMKHFV